MKKPKMNISLQWLVRAVAVRSPAVITCIIPVLRNASFFSPYAYTLYEYEYVSQVLGEDNASLESSTCCLTYKSSHSYFLNDGSFLCAVIWVAVLIA